jgi:hypothetical protein
VTSAGARAPVTNTIRMRDDASLDGAWDPTAVTDWDGVIFYPPMPVKRDPSSTAPEPSRPSLARSDLDLLRWHAGLLAFDTGIVANVGAADRGYGLVVNDPDGGFTRFSPRDQDFVEGVMAGIRVAVQWPSRAEAPGR